MVTFGAIAAWKLVTWWWAFNLGISGVDFIPF